MRQASQNLRNGQQIGAPNIQVDYTDTQSPISNNVSMHKNGKTRNQDIRHIDSFENSPQYLQTEIQGKRRTMQVQFDEDNEYQLNHNFSNAGMLMSQNNNRKARKSQIRRQKSRSKTQVVPESLLKKSRQTLSGNLQPRISNASKRSMARESSQRAPSSSNLSKVRSKFSPGRTNPPAQRSQSRSHKRSIEHDQMRAKVKQAMGSDSPRSQSLSSTLSPLPSGKLQYGAMEKVEPLPVQKPVPRVAARPKRPPMKWKLTSPNFLFDIEVSNLARERDRDYFKKVNQQKSDNALDLSTVEEQAEQQVLLASKQLNQATRSRERLSPRKQSAKQKPQPSPKPVKTKQSSMVVVVNPIAVDNLGKAKKSVRRLTLQSPKNLTNIITQTQDNDSSELHSPATFADSRLASDRRVTRTRQSCAALSPKEGAKRGGEKLALMNTRKLTRLSTRYLDVLKKSGSGAGQRRMTLRDVKGQMSRESKKGQGSDKPSPAVQSAHNSVAEHEADPVTMREREEKFDYRGLLTPNLNLNEVVNSGKAFLFFDCPLIPFGQVGVDGEVQPPKGYEVRERAAGSTATRSATEPREIKEFRRIVTDKYGIEHEHFYLKEIYDDLKMEPSRSADGLSPYWGALYKAIYADVGGATNNIRIALEGGCRLDRRWRNLNIAFTYGRKVKYEDLDDPHYRSNTLMIMRSKRKLSKEAQEQRDAKVSMATLAPLSTEPSPLRRMSVGNELPVRVRTAETGLKAKELQQALQVAQQPATDLKLIPEKQSSEDDDSIKQMKCPSRLEQITKDINQQTSSSVTHSVSVTNTNDKAAMSTREQKLSDNSPSKSLRTSSQQGSKPQLHTQDSRALLNSLSLDRDISVADAPNIRKIEGGSKSTKTKQRNTKIDFVAVESGRLTITQEIAETSEPDQTVIKDDDPYNQYVAPVLKIVSQRDSIEMPKKKIKRRPQSGTLSRASRLRDKGSNQKFDFANPFFLDDLQAEITRQTNFLRARDKLVLRQSIDCNEHLQGLMSNERVIVRKNAAVRSSAHKRQVSSTRASQASAPRQKILKNHKYNIKNRYSAVLAQDGSVLLGRGEAVEDKDETPTYRHPQFTQNIQVHEDIEPRVAVLTANQSETDHLEHLKQLISDSSQKIDQMLSNNNTQSEFSRDYNRLREEDRADFMPLNEDDDEQTKRGSVQAMQDYSFEPITKQDIRPKAHTRQISKGSTAAMQSKHMTQRASKMRASGLKNYSPNKMYFPPEMTTATKQKKLTMPMTTTTRGLQKGVSQVTSAGHATMASAVVGSKEKLSSVNAGMSSLPSNEQLTMMSSTANFQAQSAAKVPPARVQSAVVRKRVQSNVVDHLTNVRSQAALLSDGSDAVAQVINRDMVDLKIKKNDIRGAQQRYRQRSSHINAYHGSGKIERPIKRKLKVIKAEDINYRIENGNMFGATQQQNAFSPLLHGDILLPDQNTMAIEPRMKTIIDSTSTNLVISPVNSGSFKQRNSLPFGDDDALFGAGQGTVRMSEGETAGGTTVSAKQQTRVIKPSSVNFSQLLKTRMIQALGNQTIEAADIGRIKIADSRSRGDKIIVQEPRTMDLEGRHSIDTLMRKSGGATTTGTGRAGKGTYNGTQIKGDQVDMDALVTYESQHKRSQFGDGSTTDDGSVINNMKTPSIAVLATSEPFAGSILESATGLKAAGMSNLSRRQWALRRSMLPGSAQSQALGQTLNAETGASPKAPQMGSPQNSLRNDLRHFKQMSNKGQSRTARRFKKSIY